MATLHTWQGAEVNLWKNVEVTTVWISWARQRVTRFIRWVKSKVSDIHALAHCTNCSFIGEKRGTRGAYSCEKFGLKISDIAYWICPDHEFSWWLDIHLDEYLTLLAQRAIDKFPKEHQKWAEKDVLKRILIESCWENPEFVDLYFQQISSKIL